MGVTEAITQSMWLQEGRKHYLAGPVDIQEMSYKSKKFHSKLSWQIKTLKKNVITNPEQSSFLNIDWVNKSTYTQTSTYKFLEHFLNEIIL